MNNTITNTPNMKKNTFLVLLILLSLGIQSMQAQTGPVGVNSGIQLWLDASDVNGTGTNPADGTTVATWADKSGAGNNAVQIAGTAPVLASGAGETINGSPTVKFTRTTPGSDTSGSPLRTNLDIRPITNEDVTIIAVYRQVNNDLSQAVWGSDSGNFDRFFYSNFRNQFGADGIDDGIVGLGPTEQVFVIEDSGVPNEVFLVTAAYDGDTSGGSNVGPANASSVSFDGIVQATFTDTTPSTSSNVNFDIGRDGDNGDFDGQIAEMIVYNRILTDEELNKINSYLGCKYGKDFGGVAPGGNDICDVGLWLKADAGTSTTTNNTALTTWEDQSANSNNGDGTAHTPTYKNNTTDNINFNPIVDFDGTGNQYLQHNSVFGTNAVTESTVYVIQQVNLPGAGGGIFGEHINTGANDRYMAHSPFTDNGVYFLNNTGASIWETYTPNPILNGRVVLQTFGASDSNGLDKYIRENGVQVDDGANAVTNFTGANQPFYVGAGANAGAIGNPGFFADTSIAEIIVYSGVAQNNITHQQIESYLAIKYGITLDAGIADYVDSNGSSVYSLASYSNDVFGIANDATQALDQQISKSVNTGAVLTLSTDTNFTTANGTHTSLTDGQFFMAGNNGATTANQITELPTGLTNTYGARIGREWKLINTGTIASVNLQFGSFDDTYEVLLDDDGDFSNGGTTSLGALNASGQLLGETGLTGTSYITLARTVTPFNCDGTLYQVYFTGTNYELVTVDPITGNFSTGVNLTALGLPGNGGWAYNPVDNLAYFVQSNSPYGLYQLDASNQLTFLGNATGITGTGDINAGAMATDGTFYIMSSSNQNIYSLDIDTRVASLVITVPAASNSLADIGVNPVDGNLYGRRAPNGQLVQITPAGVVTNIGAPQTAFLGTGAVYFTAAGEMIGYADNPSTGIVNSQETVIKVDITDGTVTPIATGPSTIGNDGFSCAFSLVLEKGLAQPASSPGGTNSYTFTFTNQSGGVLTNVNFADALTTGYLWASEPTNLTGGITLGATSINGTATGNFTITSLPIGESSFDIDLQVPAAAVLGSTFDNQATLTGLPSGLSATVVSDDPNTAAVEDVTTLSINASPGSVGENLALWLKADAGTSSTTDGGTIATWSDQSGQGFDVTATGTVQPTFQNDAANLVNFNPSVLFDGADDVLTRPNPLFPNTNLVTDQQSIFTVVLSNTTAEVSLLTQNTSSDKIGPLMTNAGSYVHNDERTGVNFTGIAGPAVITTQPILNSAIRTGLNVQLYSDAVTGNSGTLESNLSTGFTRTDIGARTVFNTQFYNGRMLEVIAYGNDVATDRTKIESYLAIKYGITLNNGATAYLDAADNTVWTVDATYDSDIFGIARDDASALNQEISKSVNTGAIVTLSTSADFTTANDGSRTDLTDGQFLMVGNDGASGAIPGTPNTTDLDVTAYYTRTAREWKAVNTAAVGEVNLQFDGYDDTWVVLTRTVDGNFSATTGTTETALSATGTVATTLTGTTFFTLARKVTSIEFEAATASDVENTGGNLPNLLINGTLNADTDIDVVINAAGTATAATDYTLGGATGDGATTITVTIPANTYTTATPVALSSLNLSGGGSVTFAITGDTNIEADETINLTINNAQSGLVIEEITGGALIDTHVYTITNDDTPTWEIGTTATIDGDEDGTDVVFTVELTDGAGGTLTNTTGAAITADVAFTGAAVQADFTTTFPTSVSIADGASSATITLVVNDDALVEATEALTATISNASTGTISATADNDAADVADNDAAQVSIVATTQSTELGIDGVFTITTTNAISTPTTINYTVTGTATAAGNVDYTQLSGTVVLPANTLSVTLDVVPTSDTIVEDDETVIVTLDSTDSTEANIAANPNNTATVTITDNDTAIVSVTADATADESVAARSFTLTMDRVASTDVDITYVLSGAATNPADYTDTTAVPGTVTILAGATTGIITINVVDDANIEITETVIATLNQVTSNAAIIGDITAAELSILDNDTATWEIGTTAAVAGDEDGTDVVFTVELTDGAGSTLTNTTGAAITADVAFTGAAVQADFTTTFPTSVSIADGASSATITLVINDDVLVEVNETITATISNASSGTISATADNDSVNVTDNDSGSLTISIAQTTDGTESATPTNAQFTVSLDLGLVNTTGMAITGTIAYTGIATEGSDYTGVTTFSIADGDNATVIDIPVLDDTEVEVSETIIATISAPNIGSVSATDNATANITDDDDGVLELEIVKTQDGSEDGDDVIYTIVLTDGAGNPLTNGTGSVITADIAFTGTAAQADLADVFPTSINIADTALSTMITFTVVDDVLVESTETLTATLSNPNIGTVSALAGSVDATITDNDLPEFTVTPTTLTIDENGGTGTFTVVLDAQPITDVVIDISSGDTGEATVDLAQLTFTNADWNIPQTITVTGVDDITVATDMVTITAAINDAASDDGFDALADKTVAVTLNNDDLAVGPTVSDVALTIDENGGTGTFTIVMASQPGTDVIINLASLDLGEATIDLSQLTFTNGNWNIPQTVTVTGVDDSDLIGDATSIDVTIDPSSDPAFTAFPDQSVAVTLVNDDIAATANGTQISTVDGTAIANGTDMETITVQLKDDAGLNLMTAGINVSFAVTGSAMLSSVTATTDANGMATITITNTVAEMVDVTATVDADNDGGVTPELMVVNGSPAQVDFAPDNANPSTTNINTTIDATSPVIADNTSVSNVSIQLADANGNLLTMSGGGITIVSTGTALISTILDNGDGTYSATVTNTVAETVILTAALNGTEITDKTSIMFIVGMADPTNENTTITATGPVVADGMSTSTVTVQLADAFGNLLMMSGGTVTLVSTSTTAMISAVVDNGDGTYTATITNTVPETITITGMLDGTMITDEEELLFEPGMIDTGMMNGTVMKGTDTMRQADGAEMATITVQLQDANGNPINLTGVSVSFATDWGMLSASSVMTDATGLATTTLTSFISGNASVTATLDHDADATTAEVMVTNNSPIIVTFTPFDSDGDGIFNIDEDTDEDNDPTNDDCDNDGTPNFQDPDPCDTDGDGLPDDFEDSDGDGNPYNDDCDDDGIPNFQDPDPCDTDGDGILDQDEDLNGDDNLSNDDCDNDGIPNFRDPDPCDSDGDGIPDNEEDANGDGNPYNDDCDGDGTPDFLDTDTCGLKISTAFTPNGDGINDTWIIVGIENYPNSILKVYNRYGHEVFGAEAYQNNWDARYKDNTTKLPPSSYYFVIDLGDGSAPVDGWLFINYE